MVADPHRVNALHQARQLVQVPGIQPDGRAQRQTHAVQADGVVRTALLQHGQRRTARGEEILGMDFQKIQRRAGAPAARRSGDAASLCPRCQRCGVTQRVLAWTSVTGQGQRLTSWTALASSSDRPFMLLQVPLATYFHSLLSMSTLDWPAQEWAPTDAGAVVLTGLGNAKTLFFFLGSGGHRHHGQGHHSSCGCSNHGTLGHLKTPQIGQVKVEPVGTCRTGTRLLVTV